MTQLLRTVFAAVALVFAQSAATGTEPSPHDAAEQPLFDKLIDFGGEIGPTQVEIGLLPVEAKPGVAAGSAGYTAYLDPDNSTGRPILFAFNGGPGASSVFLHMGLLGPRVVQVPQHPDAPLPGAFAIEPSLRSLLQRVDIVLVDPPGTGFSKASKAEDGQIASVKADAFAIADLVRKWLARHGRGDSPVFLLGESYGTIRAVAMLEPLRDSAMSVDVRGVMLLGQALNMIETSQRPDNVVTYPVSLPTLAAIACYFRKAAIPCTPQEGARTASAFSQDYLDALFQGRDINEADKERVAERLEQLTGIPVAYYLGHNLRISKERFRTELLRGNGMVLGRYDARYVAPAPPGDPELVGPDAFSEISRRMGAAIVPYLRDRLGVSGAGEYRELALPEGQWSYGGADSPFADWPFMASFERHAQSNRCLRLFVGTGMFDLTTTIGAADYLFAQSDLPADRWRNETYPGGHVFYSDEAAREKLIADLDEFIADDPCQ